MVYICFSIYATSLSLSTDNCDISGVVCSVTSTVPELDDGDPVSEENVSAARQDPQHSIFEVQLSN